VDVILIRVAAALLFLVIIAIGLLFIFSAPMWAKVGFAFWVTIKILKFFLEVI